MTKVYERLRLQDISSIPQELCKLKKWVVWKLGEREKGKMSKIPVDPITLRYASTTTPSTWGTLSDAAKAFTEKQGFQGIGFVFSKEDSYVGIDIDDCRNMMTGEIFDFALKIVHDMKSYCEVSPSGTGIHIIVKGKIPGKLRRRNRIEMYDSERFFTITAKPIENYLTINEAEVALKNLYEEVFGEDERKPEKVSAPIQDMKLDMVRKISDESLLKVMYASKSGEKIKNLMDGNIAEYSDDASRATAALLLHLAYWTRGDAERMNKLFEQSELMRKKWKDKRGAGTWGWREIENAIAKQKIFYDPELEKMRMLNDTSNVDIFCGMFKGQFVWVDKWNQWLSWNGICWSRESNLEVYEATAKVQEELITRAGQLETQSKRFTTFVQQSGEGWRRAAIEKWSRPELRMANERFDSDAMLLACDSGVIDLRNGAIRAGRREDYITNRTPITWAPAAKCPVFDKFLLQIMRGDAEMVSYLWRVMGYTLTGSITERTFFIFHGDGRNGKSTLVTVMQALLGEYSKTASFTTFVKQHHEQHGPSEDIAHLAGARLVTAQEADENMMLDVALIKALTGGDKFSARFLYGRRFEFSPAFKLFLVTNHVPQINEAAKALWDRLHYVPFHFRVAEDEIDAQLTIKLLAELPGIFTRAVDGAREWYENSLLPPAKVLSAKAELQSKSDPLSEALEEITVLTPNAETRHGTLYAAYVEWCRANGLRHPKSSIKLAQYLRSRDDLKEVQRGAHIKFWEGIGLRATEAAESVVI